MTDNIFIRLNKNVYICKGYCNSLIMDCNTQRIYQIDLEAYKTLCSFLNGKIFFYGKDELIDKFITYLYEKELVIYTKSYTHTDTLPSKELAALKNVWLELRRNCNLNCIHCYNNSNHCAEINQVLSLNNWIEIVNQLKEYNPQNIILIGGEPLLYVDIANLIKHVRSEIPNATIVLYSNLTFLKKEIIDCIKNNNVKVVTSIYADNAEIHDSITTKEGSFQKTIQNIKTLKGLGVDVKANTVIMSKNQSVVDKTVSFIKELTDYSPKIDEIRPTTKKLESLIPTKSIRKNVIKSIGDIEKPTKSKIIRAISGNSCWQGKINISYDGYISPCIMQNPEMIEKYNLKNTTVKNIIEEYIIPKFWMLSKDKIRICSDCEFRYLCNDCRPLAKALEMRADNCNYDPYSGKWNGNINKNVIDK